jgi:hypothetical protein
MQESALVVPKAMRPAEVPALVRSLSKFVIEILPAALASVIGAFLFVHYQFGGPTAAGPAAVPVQAAAPASPAMMQLLREEHAIVSNYLVAQQTAEKERVAAADAADAAAAARVADAKVADAQVGDTKLADAAAGPAVTAQSVEKPALRHGRPKVVAAASIADTSTATAQLPTVLVAGSAQPATFPPQPAPQPAPARISFVGRTLAVSGHVAAVALHAVMAVGGIPSWIGHHVGAADLDTGAPSARAS